MGEYFKKCEKLKVEKEDMKVGCPNRGDGKL